MQEIPMISDWEALLRLAIAVVLGALVGIERESRDRTAGFRTHILVCLGSAVFTVISAYGFGDWVSFAAGRTDGPPTVVSDPGRIAAQIVTGIGFLGAGAILRSGVNVRGLTTAAGLWVVAAIGMAVGIGEYLIAIGTTLMVVFALMILRKVGHRFRGQLEMLAYKLTCEVTQSAEHLEQWLENKDINCGLIEINSTDEGFNVSYTIYQDTDKDALNLLSQLLKETWIKKADIKSDHPI